MRRTVLIALVALVATPAVAGEYSDIARDMRERDDATSRQMHERNMQAETQAHDIMDGAEMRYQSDIKTLELNTLSAQGRRY